MQKFIYLLAFAVLTLTACNNDNASSDAKEMPTKEMHNKEDGHNHGESHEHEGHDHGDHDHGSKAEKEVRNIKASSQKNSATSAIVDAYLSIKNALYENDKSGAAKGGKSLLAAFSAFDMTKLSKEQHVEYMDIYEDAKEQAEHIVKSPLDHQREHLEVLSTDIHDIIMLLGTDKSLYIDFCPMINGGKGGIWLSEFEDIKNPFMGNKKPVCGKVQKKIN